MPRKIVYGKKYVQLENSIYYVSIYDGGFPKSMRIFCQNEILLLIIKNNMTINFSFAT